MIRIHKIDSKLKTVLCLEVCVENGQSKTETILSRDQQPEYVLGSEDLNEKDKKAEIIYPLLSPTNSNQPEVQTGDEILNKYSGNEGLD